MKTRFQKLKNTLVVGTCAIMLLASCKKDNSTPNDEIVTNDFQLAFASGSGSISGTYLQGITDLSQGEISFSGKGYLMSTARTSRIFPSSDGSTIYSLTYTVGTIDKFTYNGGDNYTKIASFDSSIPLGATATRFTKMNDQVGSVHYITSVPQYDTDGTSYLKHKITASIGILNLETMNFGTNFNKAIDVVLPGTLATEGYNITRIDAPVISGGKIYYGAAVSKFDKTTAKNTATDKTFTLVLDYPTLTNATVIQTTHVVGATNGYRTPTQHVNEAGEILQLVSAGGKSHIVKIVNGQYNTTYKFDLSALLGRQTASNGWFYAGNGIGYIPYEKVGDAQVQIGVNPQGEPTYSSAWGLARIDLNNNTVIDLNTPAGLWLEQYQTSVIRDGKFYIALSPVGVQGNIYIFDVNSTSKDGVKGSKISSGADQYYIGIY